MILYLLTLLTWNLHAADMSALKAMAEDPAVDVRHCPQLLEMRGRPLTPAPGISTVVFCIQSGSAGKPWNSLGELVRLHRGQTLRLLNFDEKPHRLHTTNDRPCPHPPGVMEPIQRAASGEVLEVGEYDCEIGIDKLEPLDGFGRPVLYDHFDGPLAGGFFVRVGEPEFYPGTGYSSTALPFEDELTVDKLMSVIRERDLRTIESVLETLPSQMTGSNFVAMYRSQSLQSATPLLPRVLAYTPSARFVLSFNAGAESAYGGNSIEMIQYDDERARFDFYELAFDGGRPRLSEPNPQACLGCHQSLSHADADLRPNWEPYNVWPGAYGSFSLIEGGFRSFTSDSRIMGLARPQDREMIEEQAQEERFYRAFLASAPSHPRYQHFKAPKLKAATALNQVLGELNFTRVARLMLAEKEVFEKYKYLIWYYFNCYPKDRDLFARGLDRNRELLLAKKSPYEKEEYGKLPGHNHMSVGRFLTLVYEPYTDTSDWSMDFMTLGRFSVANDRFGLPGKSSDAFMSAFKHVLGRTEPLILEELSGLTCTDLAAKPAVR